MLRTGQSPAPSTGRSSPASTPGSRPTPGAALPGTLASPRTGLPPAGCRELVARLRPGALLSVASAPELLDAHSAGIGRTPCGTAGSDSWRRRRLPGGPDGSAGG